MCAMLARGVCVVPGWLSVVSAVVENTRIIVIVAQPWCSALLWLMSSGSFWIYLKPFKMEIVSSMWALCVFLKNRASWENRISVPDAQYDGKKSCYTKNRIRHSSQNAPHTFFLSIPVTIYLCASFPPTFFHASVSFWAVWKLRFRPQTTENCSKAPLTPCCSDRLWPWQPWPT